MAMGCGGMARPGTAAASPAPPARRSPPAESGARALCRAVSCGSAWRRPVPGPGTA